MSAILVADSIGKAFGQRKILVAARLEARRGSVTFIAGRNGAGKSTLLKIAAGMLQPDYGSVRFLEKIFTRPRLDRLARAGLFFLPDRDVLSPAFTIRDQLTMMTRRFGGKPVGEIAELFGITQVLGRNSADLSGGERRRAELALAFIRAPACLIADEPTRGIDPKDAEFLLQQLRSLAQEGCAVVLSGHDVTALLPHCDDVVWVTSGTTYQLGTPARAQVHEPFRREYLTGRWT